MPSMLESTTACFTKTASNQPQRLCLPVTVPNSNPFLPKVLPSSPKSSVGKGPDPTRVVYAFVIPIV